MKNVFSVASDWLLNSPHQLTIFIEKLYRRTRMWRSILLTLSLIILTTTYAHGHYPCGCVWPVAMAVDSTGNIFLLGNFMYYVDFGGGDLVTENYFDIFLAKFDSNGNHIWSTQYGYDDYNEPFDIVADVDGNIIMVGNFNVAGDYWEYLKLDAGGNLLWAKVLGTPYYYPLRFLGITVDSAKNVIICGNSDDPQDYGGGILERGFHIVKLDSAGDHVWSHSFGGARNSVQDVDLDVDGANNIILVASIQDSIDFGSGVFAPVGPKDVIVMKLDSAGNHIWSNCFGDTDFQYPIGIEVDGSNNIVFAGRLGGTIDFGGGDITGGYFLVRFDPNGNHIRSRSLPQGNIYLSSIGIDDTGATVIGGSFFNSIDFGGGTITSAGDRDVVIVKYDNYGNYVWSKGFGDSKYDSFTELMVTHAGNIVMTGYFLGRINLGGEELFNIGREDTYLAMFDPDANHVWSKGFGNSILVGVPDRAVMSPLEVWAYPNPFNPQTTIAFSIDQPGHVLLQIFDTQGHLVQVLVQERKNAGTHVLTWNGQDTRGVEVASGIYLVSLNSGGHQSNRKIVLLK